MAENSTRAWWLPILKERVRQNTINQAQTIKASHQNLRDLHTESLKRLGNLINEGEIDGDLFHTLMQSRDQERALTESDQLLASTESTSVDSSNVHTADIGSQQGSSNVPGDGTGAQLSRDASIASLSKKDAKKQRKKDKKRAKRLAENQDGTQSSAPEDSSIAKLDASAISDETEHTEDPINTAPSVSDVSNAPKHLEDPTTTKRDASAISTESEHPEAPTNANPSASDISNPENLEDPTIAKPDVSAMSTEIERLEDPIIAVPDISAMPIDPDHPTSPSHTKRNASDISNAPEHLEDPTIAKPDFSAISTEPEHSEDPTKPKPDISAISTEIECLEDPIIAEPEVSAISTEPEHPKYPTNTKPNASDILNAPEHLGDPTVAKPDVSSTSTEPERLEDPIVAKPHVSTISTEPEPTEDPTIAKPDVSAISTELEHHKDPNTAKLDASDISNAPEHLGDLTVAKTDVSAISTEPERLGDPVVSKPGISAISTEPEPSEDPIKAKLDTSDISNAREGLEDPIITKPDTSPIWTEQEQILDHPILAKPDISAKSTVSERHLPSVSVSTKEHSDPTQRPHGEVAGNFKTGQSTKIESEEPLRNTTSIQSNIPVITTKLDSDPPADSHNISEDTVRIKAESFVTAAGSGVPWDSNSPRVDLSTPTSSRIVPQNTSAESKESASPISFERNFESRSNPEALALPAFHRNTSEDLSSAQSDASAVLTRPSNLFENRLIEKLEDAATSGGPDSAFEDAVSAKSDDPDSPAEFHTPPENISGVDFDHRGEPSGIFEVDYGSNSDDIAIPTRETASSDVITGMEALIQSEPASVTPQRSSALEVVNSSSIATPNITSSTVPNDMSEGPSQVDVCTVDKPAAAMGQIDDHTNLSSKESNSISTDELNDESTQKSTADSTEERTDHSTSNITEASNDALMNSSTQESMEGSRDDEEVGDTQHNTDDFSKAFVSGSSDENSEDSAEEAHEDEQDPDLPVMASEPVSGAMGLKWAYATHTPADNALLAAGVYLFEKLPDHFRWQPYVWKRKGFGIEQAPVVIDTLGDTPVTPMAEFDNHILYINTHMVPWADLRAEYSHPDFLLPTKLVEYQAAESMGLNVWRHDRNLLDCRLLSCRAKVADHNPASVVCFGCGPKTIVRYCSVAHMVADLKEHWRECGHEDLVIKRVVDHTTAPSRFGSLCPAIRDSRNIKSYALYRQGLYAMLNRGRYTLFDWETEEPTVLVWTKDDVRRGEMERRVERLLNFALFDQRNKVMVGLLFRLLRQCLQLKNSWCMGTIYALKKQFGEEFGLDASKVVEDRVCECEWVGEGLAEALHLPACRRLYRGFGRAFHGSGMRGYLEMYEARYWILRAWQQQHAAVGHWSDRAAGEGFEGEVEGKSPVLGPGWTGWGAEEDDRSL